VVPLKYVTTLYNITVYKDNSLFCVHNYYSYFTLYNKLFIHFSLFFLFSIHQQLFSLLFSIHSTLLLISYIFKKCIHTCTIAPVFTLVLGKYICMIDVKVYLARGSEYFFIRHWMIYWEKVHGFSSRCAQTRPYQNIKVCIRMVQVWVPSDQGRDYVYNTQTKRLEEVTNRGICEGIN